MKTTSDFVYFLKYEIAIRTEGSRKVRESAAKYMADLLSAPKLVMKKFSNRQDSGTIAKKGEGNIMHMTENRAMAGIKKMPDSNVHIITPTKRSGITHTGNLRLDIRTPCENGKITFQSDFL